MFPSYAEECCDLSVLENEIFVMRLPGHVQNQTAVDSAPHHPCMQHAQPVVQICRQPVVLRCFLDPPRPATPHLLLVLHPQIQSFALAIVGAEYLAGIVPVGTHDWRKFVPPEALAAMLHAWGFPREGMETCGLMYNPVSGRWNESEDLDVNYIITALRVD